MRLAVVLACLAVGYGIRVRSDTSGESVSVAEGAPNVEPWDFDPGALPAHYAGCPLAHVIAPGESAASVSQLHAALHRDKDLVVPCLLPCSTHNSDAWALELMVGLANTHPVEIRISRLLPTLVTAAAAHDAADCLEVLMTSSLVVAGFLDTLLPEPALVTAAKHSSMEVLADLLDVYRVDIDAADLSNLSALQAAVLFKQPEAVRVLLRHHPDLGRDPPLRALALQTSLYSAPVTDGRFQAMEDLVFNVYK